MNNIKILTVAAVAMLYFLAPAISVAGEADVLQVRAEQGRDGTWNFRVTVRHDDEGWDHYADRWEVLDPEGNVLGTRILAHPHVGEQPFTRSLSGVRIPRGIDTVVVRARDSVHGYGGAEVEIQPLGR